MIIKLKRADFSNNNINALLNSYFVSITGGSCVTTTTNISSVSKDNPTYSNTFTVNTDYSVSNVEVTMGGSVISGAASATTGEAGTAITISVPTVTGNISIKFTYTYSGVEEPDPTNYTFTINPTPSTATIALTASGYTQSGNSITVASGTTVNWSVSASGYTTQSGTQVVTSTSSKSVSLVASGDVVGNNIFDWNNHIGSFGNYGLQGTNGVVEDSSNINIVTIFLPVTVGETYYFYHNSNVITSSRVEFYTTADASGYIAQSAKTSVSTVTVPSTAVYMRCVIATSVAQPKTLVITTESSVSQYIPYGGNSSTAANATVKLNIFDASDTEILTGGYALQGLNGAVTTSANNLITGFISLDAYDSFGFYNNSDAIASSRVEFYTTPDASGYISQSAKTSVSTVMAPATAKYMRCVFSLSDVQVDNLVIYYQP